MSKAENRILLSQTYSLNISHKVNINKYINIQRPSWGIHLKTRKAALLKKTINHRFNLTITDFITLHEFRWRRLLLDEVDRIIMKLEY